MKPPRRIPLLAATHGAAIFLGGLCLTLWTGTFSPSDEGEATNESKVQHAHRTVISAVSERRKGTAMDDEGRVERLAVQDYQDAWDAIPYRNQTVAERKELQMAVLRQWSLVDLPAALRAVMQDGQWLDRNDGSVSAQDLTEAFQDAVGRDPLGAWHLLESTPDLTMGSREVFHDMWVGLQKSDPEIFLKMLGHLPGPTSESAAEAILSSPKLDDPSRRHALLRELASKVPGDKGLEMVMMAIDGNPGSEAPELLLERLQTATEEPERRVAVAEYFSRIRQEPATLRESWAKIAPEIREATIDRFFSHGLDLDCLLPVLDIAMEEGRVALLAKPEATKAVEAFLDRDLFLSDESQRLTDWAMALPAREDTEGVFRAAVRARLKHNKDDAREWVEEMPVGWHRDHAMEELERSVAE